LAQRHQPVGRVRAGTMKVADHRGNGDRRLLVAAAASRVTEGPAVEPFHENSVAVNVEDGGRTVPAIPLQQAGTPALFIRDERLEDLERRKIATVLLDT